MIATLTLAAALAVPSPVGPETRYDPRIPTLKQVTGHELGEEISTPEEIGAYLAGARGGGARPRARRRVRAERGGPAPARAGPGQPGAPRAARRRPEAAARARRPARAVARRGRPPRARAPGRRVAPPRRPRQRDLVLRRGARARPPPPRRGGRPRRRPRAARDDRAHRSAPEPGRPRALPGLERPGPRGPSRPRARLRRARRAVAGRPREPLPLRHEPRLVRADRSPRPAGASTSSSTGTRT